MKTKTNIQKFDPQHALELQALENISRQYNISPIQAAALLMGMTGSYNKTLALDQRFAETIQIGKRHFQPCITSLGTEVAKKLYWELGGENQHPFSNARPVTNAEVIEKIFS